MDAPIERFDRARKSAVLDMLVKAGWVDFWSYNDKKKIYAINWTDTGLERRWLIRKMESELNLSPDDRLCLVAFCLTGKPSRKKSD